MGLDNPELTMVYRFQTSPDMAALAIPGTKNMSRAAVK
jgi:hypothetical protein